MSLYYLVSLVDHLQLINLALTLTMGHGFVYNDLLEYV